MRCWDRFFFALPMANSMVIKDVKNSWNSMVLRLPKKMDTVIMANSHIAHLHSWHLRRSGATLCLDLTPWQRTVPSSHSEKLYGCFQKKGYPQIINFNRVFPSILGYPYFWKQPYVQYTYHTAWRWQMISGNCDMEAWNSDSLLLDPHNGYNPKIYGCFQNIGVPLFLETPISTR